MSLVLVKQRKLKRNLFSGISQVDFDSNGRFLIPKKYDISLWN